MSVAAGTRFGAYDVVALIGAGAMGEVYRARDGKLQRDVAIKVLPAAFAADADRVARFEREARTLAALNHPNIAHIYGLDEAQDTKVLVMELVEGPTLGDRIAEGAIPLDEALLTHDRSRQDWKRRTTRGSSIAISSLPTSKCELMEQSSCWISVSRRR